MQNVYTHGPTHHKIVVYYICGHMLESDQDRIFCTHTKVIAQRVVYYHMGNSVFLTDPKHRMDMEDGGISSYTGDFRKKESYIKTKG